MTRPDHHRRPRAVDDEHHGSVDTLDTPLPPLDEVSPNGCPSPPGPSDEMAPDGPGGNSRSGVVRCTDGTALLVCKRATGGARAGLRREAEVLTAVGGTEVVPFVELRDRAEVTELVLRDVGGGSLAAALADPSTSAAAALELLAAACEAVARLHARGWGHGRLDTDHMLVTPRRRIRLCSLRSAAPIDVDPDTARADRVALLRAVDDWTFATAERTRRRLTVGRIRARLVARRTHRLQDDPDPQVLARILRRTARAGDVPVRRPLRTATAVALGAIVLFLAGWSISRVLDAVAPTPAAPTPTIRTPPASQPTPAGTAASAAGTGRADLTDLIDPAATKPSTCPTGAAVRLDVDGDGCGDDVRIEDHVVVVDGLRYRVGMPGDVVVIGDWDCDTTATAAVLRPSTGTVHVFSTWASEGAEAVATDAGTVDGAVDFAPAEACGPPRIVTDSGQVVDTDRATP